MEKFNKNIKRLRETKFVQDSTSELIKGLAAELLDEYLTLKKKYSDIKKVGEKISEALQSPFETQFEALCQRTRTQSAFVAKTIHKKKEQILIGGDAVVKNYLVQIMKMAGENSPEKKSKLVGPDGNKLKS